MSKDERRKEFVENLLILSVNWFSKLILRPTTGGGIDRKRKTLGKHSKKSESTSRILKDFFLCFLDSN